MKKEEWGCFILCLFFVFAVFTVAFVVAAAVVFFFFKKIVYHFLNLAGYSVYYLINPSAIATFISSVVLFCFSSSLARFTSVCACMHRLEGGGLVACVVLMYKKQV